MKFSNRFSLSNWRALLAWSHDIMAAALALVAAYAIRFNLDLAALASSDAFRLLPWILPVQALIFWATGLYRGLWRYASLPDFRRIALAALLATMAVPLVVVMARFNLVVPRTVIVLLPVFMVVAMAGTRVGYRMWRERRGGLRRDLGAESVIVVGAGDAASRLLRELKFSQRYRAVALLDDDRRKLGRVMHGVRVVGSVEQYPLVASQLGSFTAIVAMPGVDADLRRRAVDICAQAGARIMTVPTLEEMIRKGSGDIRQIEVGDLLGRAAVSLDLDALSRSYSNRVVLVTGAGGSIGSELCRQLVRFGPSLLVLVDISEFALYNLTEEFSRVHPDCRIAPIVGDVKNSWRMDRVLAEYRPAVIIHAAAYKHVPMMEDLNTWEAIRNNAYGTYTMGSLANKYGAERFVLISTDKAVNPTNVMGASKRLAELVCHCLNQEGKTQFEMVRFGNVLGSSGSVIPKFQSQITSGGPITVTHPEVIRFFMSIPEAAQLVLQAGAMGKGGEIFVLDMGEPVRIIDLARDMIRLAGLTETQIPIQITGLRPGEKLYEELLADGELTMPTDHIKVRVARPGAPVAEDWLTSFLEWARQDRLPSDIEVRRDLRRWVPEYTPAQGPQLRKVS